MKKKLLKILTITLVIALSFSMGAYAASNNENIMVLLNRSLTITYRGQPQTLRDANGNQVYPISYEGSTYLPVRAITNMLNVPIEWDGYANAVHIDPTFVPGAPSPYEVWSLTITYSGRPISDFTQNVGAVVRLGVSVEPPGAEFIEAIVWESSDTTVFDVAINNPVGTSATVTIIGDGTADSATLTVSMGEITAECIIRVAR